MFFIQFLLVNNFKKVSKLLFRLNYHLKTTTSVLNVH